MLTVKVLNCLSDNYTYLLYCQESGATAALDPGAAKPILAELDKDKKQLDKILITHPHFDHIGGIGELKKYFPKVEVVGFTKSAEQIPEQNILVKEGSQLKLGNSCFDILECPGHTQYCINYYEAKQQLLFSGDSLFLAGCGRLLGGDANQLYQSLAKIKNLPTDTKIYFGHNYSLKNLEFALSLEPDNPELQNRYTEIRESKTNFNSPTTLKEELATNPFLRLSSETILKSVMQKANSTITDSIDLFTKIRQLKDSF